MMAEETETKLSDRQRLFVVEYASCLNATRAAMKAGYSEATAQQQGSRLLLNVVIRAEIDKLLAERVMSPMEVLERFGQQARGDHAQFLEDDFNGGVYVNLKKLCEAGFGHLIKSITRDAVTKRITKVEFYDSQSALVHLGKHHKLFTERSEVSGTIIHEHSGTLTIEQALELSESELASRQRDALGAVAETKRRW
jgi:phage terminase small subunit